MSHGLRAAISSSGSVSRVLLSKEKRKLCLGGELRLANKMCHLFPQFPARPWSLPCALPGITFPDTQDPQPLSRGNKPALFIPTSRKKQEDSDWKRHCCTFHGQAGWGVTAQEPPLCLEQAVEDPSCWGGCRVPPVPAPTLGQAWLCTLPAPHTARANAPGPVFSPGFGAGKHSQLLEPQRSL